MTDTVARAGARPAAGDAALVERAVSLAADLLTTADAHRTRDAERRRARLGRLLDDAAAKQLTLEITDAVLRVPDRKRAARLLAELIGRHGAPRAFGPIDRLSLRGGALLAPHLPRLVMPLVARRVRNESRGVVLPAEEKPFTRYVERRHRQGITLNFNVLGEAVLGEDEARRRAKRVAERLSRTDVDYVSVKVSSIASQLDVFAFDATVQRVADRLRPLYAIAAAANPAKMVNLDMEEHRDLELTLAVFRRLLDEPAFDHLEAGIVLQGYLPDSHAALDELARWAMARHGRTGTGIKVRLVKGANLAMEQVEAELRGWPQAPYPTKADVDASYKRLLDTALRPDVARAIRLGVASHNLFDVAWALVLADERGLADRIEIEMLEGMAEAEANAVRERAGKVLLYAPITRRDDFASAVAYLVRRLDENTAPENFLRAAFSMRPGSPAFDAQAELFRASVTEAPAVSTEPRRVPRPLVAVPDVPSLRPFHNEPDTDVALAGERERLQAALREWRERAIDLIPVVVGGERIVPSGEPATGIDPSAPRAPRYQYALADVATVDRAVTVAREGQRAWAACGATARRAVLARVAEVMARDRYDTVACMSIDGGKTVAEADPEVSEAIDFARYYGGSAEVLAREVTAAAGDPLGVVLVAPPWNFPYAIPAGGVLAALAAGNAVILKPAPETVLTAWQLANQLWEGGVPPDVLQFLPCPDDEVGRHLVTHDGVDAVILTGSWDTARMFLGWKPSLRLFAETSGKNALVVTAAADVDAAVRDLVRSAFGHAGQKCSAASLGIVEGAMLDHPAFLRQLQDAVRTLVVGAAWDPSTTMGPLIRPPEGPLARAFTSLDDGERWLVEPRPLDADGFLWSPGVKLGVQPGSWFHRTECFGPVLGIMRAPDLDTAIQWQNDVAYGLTGGIHSLDVDEIERWCEHVQVGNAYVNRHTTGAIVRRQPFGGWKRSVVGPGAKAGGPSYVALLQRWRALPARVRLGAPAPAPDRLAASVDRYAVVLGEGHRLTLASAAASYERWWRDEFGVGHDPSGLRAEADVLRYRPLPSLLLRAGEGADGEQVALALLAAEVCGVPVTVSAAQPMPVAPDAALEDDAAFVERLQADRPVRCRVLGHVSDEARLAAFDAEVALDDLPVLPDGRLELLRYLREQAVSITTHRYGNVGTAPVPVFATRASRP